MFVDICFPKENEADFIKTARKINTESLCFVYDKPSNKANTSQMKIFTGLLSDMPFKKTSDTNIILSNNFESISKNRKVHVYYEINQPRINQVLIKKLVMEDKLIGISFNYVLKCLKDPVSFGNLCFFVKLCRKYKAKIFAASFARSPFELRSKLHLLSVLHFLGMGTKTQKEALEQLYVFFTENT